MMEAFKQQECLVVGGAGFVGSALVRTLLNADAKVTVVDNLLSAEISQVPKAADFLLGSIADEKILQQLKSYDYIFHLATYHGNQSSIQDPIADHANNTYTSLRLFEHFKNNPPKKLVYASAGCTVAEKTFDTAQATHEDASVSLYLDSPYQISKIIGEFYGNYYWRLHGLPFVKARFQNVYGPGEILGAGQWRGTPHTVWRNVTPTFIFKALHHQALPVENGGIATRDFIYVDDIVDGLLRLAHLGQSGEVYNLSSGVETSIGELATLINTLSENPTPIAKAPTRQWDHSGKRFGDTTKAKETLGFSAQTRLQAGLERTITWTRDQLPTIYQAIQKHHRYFRHGELDFMNPSTESLLT